MSTEPETSPSRVRRPSGLRAGIVLGLALALAGAGIGTATGAVTPFQKVVIVNAPAEPIPVTGTVNVANQPTQLDVTVTNLPATQTVSGTVNIGNFPATQQVSGTVNIGNLPGNEKVTKVYSDLAGAFDAGSTATFSFGQTINVATLIMDNLGSDDEMSLYLVTVAGRPGPDPTRRRSAHAELLAAHPGDGRRGRLPQLCLQLRRLGLGLRDVDM